jgi:hypothetical protein
MWRLCLIAVLLLTPVVEGARSDSAASPTHSRIMAEILNKYGDGYRAFCFVELEVSKKFKYTRVALPPSFYDRFIDGQLDSIQVNPPGCPTLAGDKDACLPSCGLITIFDMTALGYPTPWGPWPICEHERISFMESPYLPPGKVLLILNVHREFEMHHHLHVIEVARCDYLVYKDMVIE